MGDSTQGFMKYYGATRDGTLKVHSGTWKIPVSTGTFKIKEEASPVIESSWFDTSPPKCVTTEEWDKRHALIDEKLKEIRGKAISWPSFDELHYEGEENMAKTKDYEIKHYVRGTDISTASDEWLIDMIQEFKEKIETLEEIDKAGITNSKIAELQDAVDQMLEQIADNA